jgi:hypothetical protein
MSLDCVLQEEGDHARRGILEKLKKNLWRGFGMAWSETIPCREGRFVLIKELCGGCVEGVEY